MILRTYYEVFVLARRNDMFEGDLKLNMVSVFQTYYQT